MDSRKLWVPHPVFDMPTAAAAAAMGKARWEQVMIDRVRMIHQEEVDPLRYGWEPPIWWVCDCLLGWPWMDKAVAEQVCQALGFRAHVKVLLILGGNRAGKSEYAAKRALMILLYRKAARMWAFHASHPMSVEYQQPLFWKYMPPELRINVKSEVTYIAYKQKTGFSDDKFVLPNGSEGVFKNYEQDRDDAIEGGEIDLYWGDELMPYDWVETLLLRIATREGWGINTFTPVEGYSPTVKMFCDGARVAREAVAYMVPKDGGECEVTKALGFDTEEARRRAHAIGRWSLPENCKAWLEGRSGQPGAPVGRTFERVPRVQGCVDERMGVVYFHSSDNPYGNPASVAQTILSRSAAFRVERFYGRANKTQAVRFPKFSKVHIVPAMAIPKHGMRVHFVDPASGRNFFMKWYCITEDGVWLYREWPGNYEIPGVGVPGPWAIPDGKKQDGKMGPAQVPFGWGLLRYKMEIARLEGWKDYRKSLSSGDAMRIQEELAKKDVMPGDWARSSIGALGIDGWSDTRGAEERVEMRWIDSRAASNPKVENDRPRTLLTDFEDIGLFFELTPGEDIDEGVAEINAALDYDAELAVDFFNRPHFYVSEECQNSIFALQTWTGADGLKGATKDPIDLDRYLFRSGVTTFGRTGERKGRNRRRRGGHY